MPAPRNPYVRRCLGALLCLTLATAAAAQRPEREPLPYAERTDGVDVKLQLLEAAYAAGDLTQAQALAASLRWTLQYETQARPAVAPVALAADGIVAVDALPKAWAAWARGWSHARVLTLTEGAGLGRRGEPVDLRTAFPAEQVADLHREVRVVRVDAAAKALVEVASQVYDVRRTAAELTANLIFLADVPAGGAATYLVLHGNPNAEWPDYPTDLQVTGEGYALDIDNRHFTARLSHQMGQLDRLVYKRDHGLELFSGGKGHGEPPTIDWSNDYVDEGNFQKLRIRTWPEAPDFEVERGPLMVRVRRWGFPASPLHPVYTPSRILIDQTYTFYAGADWFRKDGVMRAVQDVDIAALRDDEWVLSGYSFDERVWVDAEGRMHEGAVPGDHAQNVWGIGFFHPDSRDAFVALFLEHDAGPFELQHSGSPTMHYYHHGQLWARYPVGQNRHLPAGTAIRNRNAYLVGLWPKEGAADSVAAARTRFLQPVQVAAADPPKRDGGVQGTGTLGRGGERPEATARKAAVWAAIDLVQDEQFYNLEASVADLGYIYDLRLRGDVVEVLVTMPHRGRPIWQFIESQGGGRVSDGIRQRVLAVPGVREVVVEHTWWPAWTVSRVTPAGRAAMGLTD